MISGDGGGWVSHVLDRQASCPQSLDLFLGHLVFVLDFDVSVFVFVYSLYSAGSSSN